jgi:hypothetical protein
MYDHGLLRQPWHPRCQTHLQCESKLRTFAIRVVPFVHFSVSPWDGCWPRRAPFFKYTGDHIPRVILRLAYLKKQMSHMGFRSASRDSANSAKSLDNHSTSGLAFVAEPSRRPTKSVLGHGHQRAVARQDDHSRYHQKSYWPGTTKGRINIVCWDFCLYVWDLHKWPYITFSEALDKKSPYYITCSISFPLI